MTRSLSEFVGFVPNALLLPEQPYQPEDITLGTYTFVSWVRSGVAAVVGEPTDGALRATVEVKVDVQWDGGKTPASPGRLALRGPADVLSLEQGQIVRRYPAPGTVNAEPNFLAHVEFDRPEVPWLFSPHAPDGEHLEPWIALVVLEDGHYTLRPASNGRVPHVIAERGQLQPLSGQRWAWAHAQVAGPIAANQSVETRLSTQFGPVNLSRLLCPRRLLADRGYLACIVPAIDAGRRVALGDLEAGTLEPAWARADDGHDAAETVDLPVFDHWRFRTGPQGSFEELAERIVPVAAPWNVGRRTLDTSRPLGGMPELAADAPGRVQVVRGPLVSPSEPPQDAIPDDAQWTDVVTGKLRDVVNLPDALALKPPEGPLNDDLPGVGPELYARYHAGRTRLEQALQLAGPTAHWFDQLNARPSNRVIAGLGTRVIQMDQEPLMQAAWAQVGAIHAANRQIRAAQLGRFAAAKYHASLGQLGDGELIAVTRRAHGRILAGGTTTVWTQVVGSAVPHAAAGPVFRRASRTRGPVRRFVADTAMAIQVRNAVTTTDFMRQYRDPDGITSLSQGASQLLASRVAARLGMAPQDVHLQLMDRSSALARPAVADELSRSTFAWVLQQGVPAAHQIGAQRVLDRIERLAPTGQPTVDPARSLSYVGLLRGLARAPTAVSARARERAHELTASLGDVAAIEAADAAGHAAQVAFDEAQVALARAQEEGASAFEVGIARGLDERARTALVTSMTRRRELDAVRSTAQAFAALMHPDVALTFGAPQPEVGPAVEFGEEVEVLGAAAHHLELGVHPAGLADVAPIMMVERDLLLTRFAEEPDAQVILGHPPDSEPLPEAAPTPVADRLVRLLAAPVEAALSDDQVRLMTRESFVRMAVDLVSAEWPSAAPRPSLAVQRESLLEALTPRVTIGRRLVSRMGASTPDWMPVSWEEWFADGQLHPIMAAPVFTRAMYRALDAYDRDWLVPGLGTIPQPDMVTALETNAAFIEAFLVGLSHEMGRELRWRDYPTDQRGTYFRRFFNGSLDELEQSIHRFEPTELRTHVVPTLDGRLVFLVRGELIRRYPDAIAYCLREGSQGANGPIFTNEVTRPMFYAPLEPDILMAGFDLTTEDVKAAELTQRYWFVVSEHPTAPRFGLDEGAGVGAGVPTRDELTWNDLPTTSDPAAMAAFLAPGTGRIVRDDGQEGPWDANAATVARNLLQSPIRAAWDAARLIEQIERNTLPGDH